MNGNGKKKGILTERAKEPSTWLGLFVLLGTGIGAAVGKPQLADPLFWQSVLTIAGGLGLIAMPQKNGKDN